MYSVPHILNIILTWNAGCSFNVEFFCFVLKSFTVLGVLASTGSVLPVFITKTNMDKQRNPRIVSKSELPPQTGVSKRALNRRKIHTQYPASPEVTVTVFYLPPCPQVARPDSGEKHFDPQL